MLDLIVRGGIVVDGTGRPAFRADVGIRAGKIEALGDLSAAEATRKLDAAGLVVAPGLIDIHSHSDFTPLVDGRLQSSVAQGVTTELVGNCGHGCAPIRDISQAQGNIYGYDPGVPVTWSTMAGYLERLQAAQPAVNLLTLVPNGMLRLAVVGLADRPATPEETRQMARELEAGLEQGAWGYSAGLEYALERPCSTAELTELCKVTARYGGLFAPHLRNRERRALEAIDEALEIARASGVRLHIPHLTPRRGGPPDADMLALRRIDQALDAGLDVSIDMHTRLHGLTNLSAALPAWAFEGGAEALRRRLRDPAARRAIAGHESLITSFALGGWERVSLLTSRRRPDLVGKSFQEIADAAGVTPFDAVLNVLLEEADDPHFPLCLCESYTEEQLRRTYEHRACMVASDATALCADGPLSKTVFHGAFTWAAWFFRRFVREERAFTLEAAIHKLTAQPAARIGLSDRGVLRAGAWADLAVFDPAVFAERGTLRQPNQLAIGMRHVIVNGIVEMEAGRFTDARAGRVLRRAG
jgi:N-acyl-D-amino-acid deacylase